MKGVCVSDNQTYDALSIVDDMYQDGASDIVLFYRTFDHIALSVQLRTSRAIGDVISPMMIHERRSRDVETIQTMLYSLLNDFVLSFTMLEDDELSADFWREHLDILTRIVLRCTMEAKSLDASITAEFEERSSRPV